jgi:hypothetical protein
VTSVRVVESCDVVVDCRPGLHERLMDHSYEEIRAVALDVLAGREQRPPYEVNQYEHLSIAIAEAIARREMPPDALQGSRRAFNLSNADRELFLEVFWELFPQGIITLGYDDSNRQFPFFRISRLGKRLIANEDTYFFHDVTSYTKLLIQEVSAIDAITLLYVQEALQAFRSGCLLSSTVMLGVATEHTFLLLIEAVDKSPTHAKHFAGVAKERTILPKVNRFKALLDQMQQTLPFDIKEDLDTRFAGILSIIRAFRNQAGHPSGLIPDREQTYVLLNLFVPYCRKMYQLRDFLRQ